MGFPIYACFDILMPRMDGLELCRKLRGQSEMLPIIFLTSKDEEFDRVLGLVSAGAATAPEERLSLGPLALDMGRYQATWKGEPLTLTVTEFMLLHALARRPGHVKSRARLMEECYPHDAYVSERTIDSHVKRLRKKFAQIDDGFSEIDTVYGLGLRAPLLGSPIVGTDYESWVWRLAVC